MKVSLIQSGLIWENPKANRDHFSGKIKSISGQTDLIVLPEMFTTGFTMDPDKIAESMQGETVSWMKSLARECRSAICGSVVIKESSHFYNRLLFVFPSGEIGHYDKRHLFSLAGEDKIYTSGKEKLIVEYKGFRICPLVCYDLRFPVFARNAEDYDLLIFVANWPEPRINAWNTLLQARAIENMSYVTGVNRIGKDGNRHSYPGQSQALDYLGKNLIEPSSEAGIFTVTLDKNAMQEARHKFGFLNDRDRFTVA